MLVVNRCCSPLHFTDLACGNCELTSFSNHISASQKGKSWSPVLPELKPTGFDFSAEYDYNYKRYCQDVSVCVQFICMVLLLAVTVRWIPSLAGTDLRVRFCCCSADCLVASIPACPVLTLYFSSFRWLVCHFSQFLVAAVDYIVLCLIVSVYPLYCFCHFIIFFSVVCHPRSECM